MNKIFRVVWSQATQSWVVVSELTKAHKKQSSSNAQKSAVNFSGNFIKSSAIALALLSGHSAYAAETAANGLIQINSTKGTATATGSDSIAIGKDSKAMGNNNSLAIGYRAQATGNDGALAIGGDSKASGKSNIALGYQAQADKDFAVAIGKGASAQKYNNAVAIGAGSQANGATSLALGMGSKATGHDSYAIGYGSDAIGEQSIAFGRTSKASNKYDIVLGSEANTRNLGKGYSIAIGVGAVSGSNDAVKSLNGNDSGGVAIGTGAYTGVYNNNKSLNSSVAVGAGAGAGYRKVDADGLPTDNATDADNNAKVLVKAFGGTTSTLDYFKNKGKADKDGFFSFQNVNINEATALGRNARAIGDQSVAIGAQSVAGQGSIVIGGNDIQAYDKKKYFKAKNPDSKDAKGVNDFDAETTPGTDKDGKKEITITEKYKELVGEKLDNTYRSSYGQDGSTVIGMQAHSTTPLGVAIGTNSIVRKGAFGATAIGSGASVLANAEAAVAIGMGSEAQGNYAVAAGTAAKAKESAVAAGYQANADKSAVAVGDSSNATTSSVAVGQLAKAEKVADIAVGQGAVASGEQGAIAMGLGTRAQGDSSIMIGGSEITKVAAQTVNYQKEKKDAKGHAVIKTTKKKEQINGEEVERTIRSVEMEAATGTIQDAYGKYRYVKLFFSY
ncbi:ESPR-type extended signal peptide-containing protein [Haemophilus haemolyticus]|uniref:ESPR-type extended signal peptide-containing protein n=1 Tax=Haemophilus haemolyticus TaxID=726 RepID=UPI000E58EDA8|nr:ESPR-type extended signal peptide-containing protein [Haemophilus haemolyticus]